MQVNRQTCQQCGSIEVRNILVREANSPTSVFVRCAKCQELVAYYELSNYYHHGKEIESYLRAQGIAAGDSARQWMSDFQRIQKKSVEGFEKALEQLAQDNKPADTCHGLGNDFSFSIVQY